MSRSPSLDDIVGSLNRLAVGSGATPARAWAEPSLRLLPAVVGHTGEEGKERLSEVLLEAAGQLDGVMGRAGVTETDLIHALLALGEHEDKPGMHDRLTALATKHRISRNTVRGFERKLVPRYAEVLLSMTDDDVQRRRREDRRPARVPIRELDVRIRWVYAERIATHHYASRQLSAQDEVDEYPVFFTYPADPIETVVRLVPIANCVPTTTRLHQTGQLEMPVRVPRTAKNDRVTIAYLIEILSDHEDRPYVRHLTRNPTKQATVSVTFRDSAPAEVFAFVDKDHSYDPGSGIGAERLVPNDVGTVTHTFAPRLGTFFGFGWRWQRSGEHATSSATR